MASPIYYCFLAFILNYRVGGVYAHEHKRLLPPEASNPSGSGLMGSRSLPDVGAGRQTPVLCEQDPLSIPEPSQSSTSKPSSCPLSSSPLPPFVL